MAGGPHILDVPEPQHVFSCSLQLLEMSFNCLEDVESTVPVSPLHLAVSLCLLVPSCSDLTIRRCAATLSLHLHSFKRIT